MQKSRKIINIAILSVAVCLVLFGLAYLFLDFTRTVSEEENRYSSRFVNTKQVLFLSSYTANYESYGDISSAIRKVFEESGISYDVNFMDLKKYDTPSQKKLMQDLIRYHLSERKYDAVLLGDDGAARFALENQDLLFKNIPMVFFGVSDVDFAYKAASNDWITGSLQKSDIGSMIRQYERMFGEKKTFVALADSTVSGYGDINQFYKLKKEYPDRDFIMIDSSSYTKEELIERLKIIDEDSFFVVLGGFEDRDGIKYTVSDIKELVLSVVKVPCFTQLPGSIGKGFAGGYIFNYKKAAQTAAETVRNILNDGENVRDIPVCEDIGGRWVFDYRVLKDNNVDFSSLPEEYELVNRPKNYWEDYKSIIIPFMFIGLGLILSLVVVARYAFEVKKQREKAELDAKYDFLTGLPNRYFISSYIGLLVRRKREFSLIMMDVDDFKNYNDFYSHACGDEILRQIGKRLKVLMDEGRFFCSRIGGDEFLLVYEDDYLDQDSPELFRLRQMLASEILFERKKLFLRNSIGVAYSNLPFSSVDELIADADFALYAAKKSGKNKTVFFNEKMKEKAEENKNITKIMEDVIVNGGFHMLYQPQIDVQTGQIHGFEALLRLDDVAIPPSTFIPIAEEGGLISKIGRIVTEMVIKQIAKWKEDGMELHQVAINFSVGQMGDLEYPAFLRSLLEKYKVDPHLIEIEITESMLLSNSTFAVNLFEEFKSMGLKLALDDFGTGYSSLNYLHYLPVDTVKLDKTMVDTYLTNATATDTDFLKNIIRLVHSMKMKFTAEGVEQKWQVDKLANYYVDYIQGFYYSKPIPGDEVEKFTLE